MDEKIKLKLQKDPVVYECLLNGAIFDNKNLTQHLLEDEGFTAYLKANYKEENKKDYGHGTYIDYSIYTEGYALKIIDDFHNEDHKLFLLWIQINKILSENCFLQSIKGIKKLYEYFGDYKKLSNFIFLLEEVYINMNADELQKELSEINYPVLEPEDVIHTLHLADEKNLDDKTLIIHDTKFLNEYEVSLRKGMYDWQKLSDISINKNDMASLSSSFNIDLYRKEKKKAILTENLLRQLVIRSIEIDRPLEWRLVIHLVSMTKLWNYSIEQVSNFYDESSELFEYWVKMNNICPRFFLLQSRVGFLSLNKVLTQKYKSSKAKAYKGMLKIIGMLEEVYA